MSVENIGKNIDVNVKRINQVIPGSRIPFQNPNFGMKSIGGVMYYPQYTQEKMAQQVEVFN